MSPARSFEVRVLSPRGRGAVAIVALSGPGALARARALTGRDDLAPGDVRLVSCRARGRPLDRALCVVPECVAEGAGGAQQVELHLHGNPWLVDALLEELGGETLAPPRDLEARARAALARAATDSGARILLDQAEGALRRELEALTRGFDRGRLAGLIERSRVARRALEPTRVVLAGPVNAGKSTLFNLLVGEQRAIVSAQPGTTRDLLRALASFGAYPIELFDVAGLREVASQGAPADLERAGQDLARELAARADWVAWLAPSGEPAPRGFAARVTTLLSRADEAPPAQVERATHALSARLAPAAAVATVHAAFRAEFALPLEPWSAGEPVAFDAASRAALERAMDADSEAAARLLLARALAPD